MRQCVWIELKALVKKKKVSFIPCLTGHSCSSLILICLLGLGYCPVIIQLYFKPNRTEVSSKLENLLKERITNQASKCQHKRVKRVNHVTDDHLKRILRIMINHADY